MFLPIGLTSSRSINNKYELSRKMKASINVDQINADLAVPNGSFAYKEPGVVITLIYLSMQTKPSKRPLD